MSPLFLLAGERRPDFTVGVLGRKVWSDCPQSLTAADSARHCRTPLGTIGLPLRTPSATAEPDWGQSGYNWEQPFGCREIMDEQALLTCMVYIGLNQVKAGMAATREDSRTSAIVARLAAWRAREKSENLEGIHVPEEKRREFSFGSK